MRALVMVMMLLSLVAHAQSESASASDAGVTVPAEFSPPPAPKVAAPAAAVVARERMLNTWGFGFLGTGSVFKATPDFVPTTFGTPTQIDRSTVPLLGVRWWTPLRRLGLELGVGAMVSAAHADVAMQPGAPIGDGPDSTEFLFHLSVPVALASTQHTIVFIAPEARAGFSRFQPDASGAGVLTATTLDFSLKAGVEIFFSFIGLDNLSIEAGVRAGLVYEAREFVTSRPLQPDLVQVISRTRFATSLVANPWDLFTSTLAARYYF
jgi:hypothetical protein